MSSKLKEEIGKWVNVEAQEQKRKSNEAKW